MEHGFEATSLRQLTSAAGVNSPRSTTTSGPRKSSSRRPHAPARPHDQERIELLQKVEREAGGSRCPARRSSSRC